jgi:hypothetical protein
MVWPGVEQPVVLGSESDSVHQVEMLDTLKHMEADLDYFEDIRTFLEII